MKLHPYLIPYTKINTKWIKDLIVRPETIKVIEENLDSKLLDISLRDDFLSLRPKGKVTKAKINVTTSY